VINWEIGQLGFGKMVGFRTGVMSKEEKSTKFLSPDTLRMVCERSHKWCKQQKVSGLFACRECPGKKWT
jgi:hypothetical protein